MHKSVSILVCGNAGAVGGELLRRRDITTHWALTPEEAIAVAERVRPKIALVREEFALEVLAATRRWRTPIVVLLEGDGWDRREPYFMAGATALVQATAGTRILEAISSLTNLAFARHPRVRYATPVEVEIAGQPRLLQSVNLSASGVCVEGVEALEEGLGARVSFPLLDPPIAVDALIVRTFSDGQRDLAGLAFTQVSAEMDQRLRALVDAEIARDEDAAVTIEVPMLADPIADALEGLSDSGDAAVGALKDKLRSIHVESRRDSALGRGRGPSPQPPPGLEGTLSASERAHVLGEPAADWVRPALDTRLKLHVERSREGAASSRTVQDALTLCRTLGKGAGDAASLAEVCVVRASLLRDVYADAPRSRHAPPTAPGPIAVALPSRPARRGKSVRA